ncbi:type VI secretion system baseplate subunit TssF [Catenovulum sp. SM1970]|uniref:type VI secretion system baseplate subunit TssF n=1 Tax=Marinifaba aquimaris TaxID=2741323 RepID=UPI00157260E4|nr:type VI secretion system baseplate subunit TssF [Marinifaba aquimaris]NTS77913.1 type VI secretion system baseplate subunit TssF [Marinifaba aquimaris]
MQQYFDQQMRLLTQAGKQFAQNYPEHAGLLNIDSLKDRDPHVERLLEGVAYLTANIQKRLDEAIPEVSEQVLRQLCPFLLNHYPSSTVLSFTPKLSMQASELIEKGLEVSAGAVSVDDQNKVECRFTTTEDVTVVPFKITNVVYQDTHLGAELKLTFKWACQGDRSNYDLSKINLYLCGDTPLASSLFQFLLQPSKAIKLSYPDSSQVGDVLLDGCSLAANFVNGQSPMLWQAAQSHPSYALLQDYFNAKERFYFVSLLGLSNELITADADEFTLTFSSEVKLPPGNQVSSQNILLNCVPAINLFKQDAEPIRLESNRLDYMVTADRTLRHSVYTHAVKEVVGVDKSTLNKTQYVPRYKSIFNDELRLYTLIIKDIGDAVPTHYIQVSFDACQDDESLSLSVDSYNASWPKRLLKEGDLNRAGQNMPSTMTVSNIIRPSNIRKCPPQPKHWQLISLLNLKLTDLTQADELKRLLALFDWSERTENRRRIESITDIETRPLNQIKQGIFVKGIEIKVVLDESLFVCVADIYHFGTLLHQFFQMYAPINESIQTKVECVPSYQSFTWQLAAIPFVGGVES